MSCASRSSSEVSSKPTTAAVAPSKVQGLARRFSALAKNAADTHYAPRNNVVPRVVEAPKSTTPAAPKKAPASVATPLAKTPEAQEEVEPSSNVADLAPKVEDIVLTETPSPNEVEEEAQEPEVAEIEAEKVAPVTPVAVEEAAPVTSVAVEEAAPVAEPSPVAVEPEIEEQEVSQKPESEILPAEASEVVKDVPADA